MKIIGINASHAATATLLENGVIKACITEERLSRVKNQRGFPVKAIQQILEITNNTLDDIDYFSFSFLDPKINNGFSFGKDLRVSKAKSTDLSNNLISTLWRTEEFMLKRFPETRILREKVLPTVYKLSKLDARQKADLISRLEKLGIQKSKIKFVNHHATHAYAAYYASPNYWKGRRLVLTLDGMGDGECATVSIADGKTIKKIASTPEGSSLGDLYSHITHYLGMKMGEHEYKVMGLAAYASEKYSEEIYKKLRELIWINKDLTWGTKIHSQIFLGVLPKLFEYQRFDNIAAATQKLTEDLMIEWVRLCIKKTGIKDVVAGGGVFMNVKANQRILDLPEVNSLFIMPSCGDESTAIGAAFFTYQQQRENYKLKKISPIKDLYLGKEYNDKEILAALKSKKYKNIKYKKYSTIEKISAVLLSKGEIVARFNGKMEWGARALGNRSINSHPSNLTTIREINSQIKSRDFWMPFAPSILKEKASKYIVNEKKMNAPYMVVSFDSTTLGKEKFSAAMHQYDQTIRPQHVDKNWNPSYWKMIKEFEKITGIGGVLNTSFNLHGFPIVESPEDALYVFENSGLKYLALGNYLVSKNK